MFTGGDEALTAAELAVSATLSLLLRASSDSPAGPLLWGTLGRRLDRELSQLRVELVYAHAARLDDAEIARHARQLADLTATAASLRVRAQAAEIAAAAAAAAAEERSGAETATPLAAHLAPALAAAASASAANSSATKPSLDAATVGPWRPPRAASAAASDAPSAAAAAALQRTRRVLVSENERLAAIGELLSADGEAMRRTDAEHTALGAALAESKARLAALRVRASTRACLADHHPRRSRRLPPT